MNMQELIKHHFEYNDGKLIRKTAPANRTKIGEHAGWKRKDGRRRLRFNNKEVYEHQVIWIMFKGDIPDGMEIDHKDLDPTNNRIDNLRLATHQQNMFNKSTQQNNKSGNKGVWWDEKRKKWQSYINIDGKRNHLGRYDTKEDAIKRFISHLLLKHRSSRGAIKTACHTLA